MEISKEFYDKNYIHFSNTRFSLWDSVLNFSKEFTKESLVLDAGCGNGKNIKHFSSICNIVGFDICKKFVEICQKKSLNVIESDILSTPFPNNFFDYIICIAVIHHFDNESDRIDAINELIRILKPGGKLLITVWAYENDKYSQKRKFNIGDNLINFGNTESLRYFYIYDKVNFEKFCKKINNNINYYIFWDKGNWNLKIEKK